MNSVVIFDPSVDFAVGAWLDEKSKRSGSKQTKIAYESDINGFRNACHAVGIDLEADARHLSLVLQAFASMGKDGRPVSSSTYNRRIASVSSFYRYCQRHGLIRDKLDNPALLVERRPVQRYAQATPLNTNFILTALKRIDRQSLMGLRDYALLLIGVSLGRRLSEVANLTWGDLSVAGDSWTLTFRHAKGGKVMRDKLEPDLRKALAMYQTAYLTALVPLEDSLSDYPMWVSLSGNGSIGRKLNIKSLERICEKHFGTSKFHALRHTFAHEMEEAGAKVSTIAARLGHENIATTGKYLTALASDENPFAASLVRKFVGE